MRGFNVDELHFLPFSVRDNDNIFVKFERCAEAYRLLVCIAFCKNMDVKSLENEGFRKKETGGHECTNLNQQSNPARRSVIGSRFKQAPTSRSILVGLLLEVQPTGTRRYHTRTEVLSLQVPMYHRCREINKSKAKHASYNFQKLRGFDN